jgi:AcrR family transcriptional regulator
VDRIVESAVALADTEGVDAVSMRRVASELGVGTMSLYRYVETKDDLLDLMTDQVMGEALTTPDDPALGWRFRLRALALRYRQVMLRHPWAVQITATRPPLGPNVLRNTERLLATLDGLGLTIEQMSALSGTVVSYVRGAVVSEIAEAEVARRTGQTEDEYRATVGPYLMQVLAQGRHPLLARFVHEVDDALGPADMFEQGLDWVLDGVGDAVERLVVSGGR